MLLEEVMSLHSAPAFLCLGREMEAGTDSKGKCATRNN